MALYYCMNELLDELDAAGHSEAALQSLIPVSLTPPSCNGYPEDAFELASRPKLLDLREREGIDQFAQLVEDVPLYGINLELILDQALGERHHNTRIEHALNRAFSGKPLPNTMKNSVREEEDIGGGLRHPMLGHLDRRQLCELYITFLQSLDRGLDVYNFERNILGKHLDRFLERFDGYVTSTQGKVKAAILIAFGARADHNPGKPVESHVQAGQKRARHMGVGEPRESIWAWLEADQYQMRRCIDVDRVMRLPGLPKVPNWVRSDIFSCIEKEAMKQIFAETILGADPALSCIEGCKTLQDSITLNARGHIDEALQVLTSQTLSHGAGYAGAALTFVEKANTRMAESRKAKLS